MMNTEHDAALRRLKKLARNAMRIRRWIRNNRVVIYYMLIINIPLFLFFSPRLHASFRLARIAEVVPTTVLEWKAESVFVPFSAGNDSFHARVQAAPDRWLPTTGKFVRGQDAYLVHAAKLDVAFVAAVQPKGFGGNLWHDPIGITCAIWCSLSLLPLIFANGALFVATAMDHCGGVYAREALSYGSSHLMRGITLGRFLLEAIASASTLLFFVGLGGIVFSVSMSIEGQRPWLISIIYCVYSGVLAAYWPASAAQWVLRFYRSTIGSGMKEVTGLFLLIFVTGGLLRKLITFVTSDRVTQLDGWIDVVKEFLATLFA